MPIVWVSRILRRTLPERVAGSDLVPALFDAVSRSHRSARERTSRAAAASATVPTMRVFLLGARPGVAEEAAKRIHGTWPGISVVGTYSPPLGFETDVQENERIVAAIAAAEPDLLIVGFGAPKQELWTSQHYQQLRAKVVLCVGATIDFLAGAKSRSPRWMRKAGMEWLHRMLTEPRRLTRRYARDAWVFPRLVWSEWRGYGSRS
jgi:N-acetylglucosaminyldiphosphoundecaprenol N-acetyl-beta-D-mannosaminyltransferase